MMKHKNKRCFKHIAQVSLPSTHGTAMQITAHSTLVRTTGAQSTPRVQQTPTSSLSNSTSSDPNLASMLQTKKISLHELYTEDTTNLFSFFPLFSQIDDPSTFEEAVKEAVWEQAMDEEIICIENNQTPNLVDVREDKDVISVICIYKTKKYA